MVTLQLIQIDNNDKCGLSNLIPAANLSRKALQVVHFTGYDTSVLSFKNMSWLWL